MAAKKIEAERVHSTGRYRVLKTTNTTTPVVGEFLTKEQVDEIINGGESTVVISEAARRGVRKLPY